MRVTDGARHSMMFEGPKQKVVSEIGYTDFVTQVAAGRVHDVTISGGEVLGHYQDNRAFSTYVTSLATLLPKLEEHKVNITVRPEGEGSFWVGLLINLAPVFLFFALWVYLSRRGQGGGGVISTTFDEFYQIMSNGNLVKGATYRITDYQNSNFINGWRTANNNPSPTPTNLESE